MNATLSYTEQLLAQMHTRALRGVVLALLLSFLIHLGITLVKLGGDSFSIRFDAPVKSGDALKAQLQPRPQPVSPAPTQPVAPSVTPPAPPAPPPVLRDRASVNLVERDTLAPIETVPPTPVPAEPIPMPTPLPEPVTRRFETDRSNAPTRVERSERLPNLAAPTAVPPLDLKPLPPLDITPAKREPVPQKQAEAAKPIEPPKAIAEPAPAPPSERVSADAPKDAPKAAANETAKSAPAEPTRDAPPSTPQNAPASPTTAAPTLPAQPAAAAPVTSQPTLPTAATPVLAAPSSPAAATQSTSAAPNAPASSGSSASATSAPRGATVTLPGNAAQGGPGAAGSASGARDAPSAGAREGTGLRPGFIDGFDPDAARRNAARDAARDLNSRRSLVPPSVAPSPTAREREAKAIENAVREDCKDKMQREPNLLAIPLVVAGQLVDKGCRIR